MIKITTAQKEYLSSYIDDIDDLLTKETDEQLLSSIDDVIVNEYDDQQENLSEEGVKLQKIYDEIFEMND
ncbi:hypothetical protein [Scatolibacter rhodanostii]|uniref:hypothetical protein n=1 Tax=Scatolibacter rhodanostii TaxID=2014781 RepID=UPI000C078530|nr:hypothetical protein [Scatolibacter rhodanostii]